MRNADRKPWMAGHAACVERAERVTCAFAVVWLQLVGVVTESVVHHILHALPIAALLLVQRSHRLHFTSGLTAFAWVFMLSAVTPMISIALIHGDLFGPQPEAFMWLAPGMALISALWLALNLSLLTGTLSRLHWYLLGGVAMVGLFGWLHPWISQAFDYPLRRTIEKPLPWGLILLLELIVVVCAPAWCMLRLPGASPMHWSARDVAWQAGYWLFFLVCMVLGLSPALN